jgi:hypothetical protein
MEISPEQVRAILRSELREKVISKVRGVAQILHDPSSIPDAVLRNIASDALEVLNDDGPEVEVYEAEQSKGIYLVVIVGVEGAYFVRAIEYDDQGLFSSLEEARSELMFHYGEFLVSDDRADDDHEDVE